MPNIFQWFLLYENEKHKIHLHSRIYSIIIYFLPYSHSKKVCMIQLCFQVFRLTWNPNYATFFSMCHPFLPSVILSRGVPVFWQTVIWHRKYFKQSMIWSLEPKDTNLIFANSILCQLFTNLCWCYTRGSNPTLISRDV